MNGLALIPVPSRIGTRSSSMYIALLLAVASYSFDFPDGVGPKLLNHPQRIGIPVTADGEVVHRRFRVWAVDTGPVGLYDFASDDLELVSVCVDDDAVTPGDTAYLGEWLQSWVEISFVRECSDAPSTLSFRSSLRPTARHELILFGDEYEVSHRDVRAGALHTVDVSGACTDSVDVYFPVGGTVTSVALYDGPEEETNLRGLSSYRAGAAQTPIRLATSDTVTYAVVYRACHWGNDFQLRFVQ